MEKVLTKEKTVFRESIFITRQDIARLLLGIFGFFIGRVVVFEFVNPIIMALLSAFFGTGLQFYILLTLSAAGMASKLTGIYLAKYAICCALAVSANIFLTQFGKFKNVYMSAAVMSGIVFISGMFLSVMNSISFYFFIMAAFEAFLTFCLAIVLKTGSDVAFGARKRKVLSNEEIISLAILFGAAIAGSADIFIADLSLKILFCSLVILIAAHKGGSAFGATVGMILGVILYLTGQATAVTAIIFSMAGLTSSIFKLHKKIGNVVGLMLGGLVACLYLEPSLLNPQLLYSVSVGSLLFCFMPNNFYFNINTSLSPMMDNSDEYIMRIKEITNDKLISISNSFSNLSKTFSGLAEKKQGLGQKDVVRLIDEVAVKACSSCTMREFCWQRNFYDTYQTVFGILGSYDKTGCLNLGDIPLSFKENCINVKKFVDVTNRLFEIYKTNLNWHNEIIESRELVSQQLFGVSKIIKGLASELDLHLNFNNELEESIIAELNKNKIEVDSVIVLENKLGKYEVTIDHRACYGKRSCNKEIVPIISRAINKRMRCDSVECVSKKDRCRLRLVEEQRYKVTSGVAKQAKTGSSVSGDSYSFMELKNGQCLLALSDGMGSGRRAHEESAAAIELLEDFIESGFDKDVAVKMINSVLVLKSSDETFSTLDICSVDLYTGAAEFIKIGAASTYLLRDGTVYTVKSSSLPIGMLDTVDLEISSKKLRDNDMIIMLTDGVSEINEGLYNKDAWLKEALSKINSRNPQEIAEYILETAQKLSENEIKDDMTVLVSRLWEKA